MQSPNVSRRCRWIAAFAAALLLSISPAFAQQQPAPGGASATRASQSQPPATAPSGRTVQDILGDLNTTGQELQGVLSSPTVLTDEAKRNEASPKVLPVLKKMSGLADELKTASGEQGGMLARQIRNQLLPLMAAFGDAETTQKLEAQAASANNDEALPAKSALLMARWVKASKDAAAQGKILDEAEQLAKANPTSNELTGMLMGFSQLGAATPELASRSQDIISNTMTSSVAAQLKDQISADKKLKSVQGKPLTIKGKTVDGKDFSTDQWKGKVILVDFWATWCGPCKEELPRVKKAYADFHEKGLEVLGVSNDRKADDLTKFVAADPGMPWPQLFDAAAAAAGKWNPITEGFGINGIPTMFLIDKKGVVRTVEARENFEEEIPKLLAEQSQS